MVSNVKEAEKWRVQIIREISKKVSQIQNAGLGEFKIRDLNDEINKLLREKRHWEIRIVELGGPNYRRFGPRMLDHEGREVPGNRGYKYFGAARDLPGVRELFEQEPPPPPRKTRADLMKEVDADYYGYRDDDDGVLVPLEREAEMKAVQAVMEEWKAKGVEVRDKLEFDPEREMDIGEGRTIVHVLVPTQKDIELGLLNRRKRELLAEYVDDDLDDDDGGGGDDQEEAGEKTIVSDANMEEA
ncbi:unnamed protein product [Notodromas monacha]|uniref:Pre-mRNA-splicing factor ISY1 n=1 Tax=Notodromas monacha TaxID=399045 RepID=A0A7R9BSX5_9CRUS|nr:unnamed protein product [Notodromas monacha]CAG0921140.1 unnamed protein product [Notodromas monacha]